VILYRRSLKARGWSRKLVKQYEWVPTGVWTITKPVPQHPLPSIIGNMGGSAVSEIVPKFLEKTGG